MPRKPMKAHSLHKKAAGFSLLDALITLSVIALVAVLFVLSQRLSGWDPWIAVPLLVMLSLVIVTGGIWLFIRIADALSRDGTVEIKRNGKTYAANWWVEKGILKVSTAPGIRETPLGDSDPEALARRMLIDKISSDEANAKPEGQGS